MVDLSGELWQSPGICCGFVHWSMVDSRDLLWCCSLKHGRFQGSAVVLFSEAW